MKPETKESHPKPFAITGLSLKQLAAFCSGELTHFQWDTVQYLYEFIMILRKIMKQPLLYFPKVSALTSKIGSIRKLGETTKPMPFEVLVNALISVQSQEFSHHFHSNQFTVTKLGQRSSLPQLPVRKKLLNEIVHCYKGGDYEIIDFHDTSRPFYILYIQTKSIITLFHNWLIKLLSLGKITPDSLPRKVAHRVKIKVRKEFDIYKCKNDDCPYYKVQLALMTKKEKELFKKAPFRFKLRYIYREFKYDFKPLSKDNAEVELPKVDISRIHSSSHTLGLILTYYVNYGLSSRRTAAVMKDVHQLDISRQTVLNYAEAVGSLVKPFVDDYPYELSGSFCGDETYLKVQGKWQYLFFFFDALKKIILSYRLSPNRDTLSAIKALDDVLAKLKSLPDDLSFVVDSNPIYLLAQHYFAQHGIYFDIHQVIGLTNDDPVSEEHRPLKEIIERLNRTFKRS